MIKKHQLFFQKNQWFIQRFFVQQFINANFCYVLKTNQKNIIYYYIYNIYINDWNHINNAYKKYLQKLFNCLWLKKHHEKFQTNKETYLTNEIEKTRQK